jgi:hypothetical protein
MYWLAAPGLQQNMDCPQADQHREIYMELVYKLGFELRFLDVRRTKLPKGHSCDDNGGI